MSFRMVTNAGDIQVDRTSNGVTLSVTSNVDGKVVVLNLYAVQAIKLAAMLLQEST